MSTIIDPNAPPTSEDIIPSPPRSAAASAPSPSPGLDARLKTKSSCRLALAPLGQPQFQNLRASVSNTLPPAAILALSPSHGGGSACGSFDSLDDKVELEAAVPGPSATTIVVPIITGPATVAPPAASVAPAASPKALDSPAAAMPYSVPKHHSRKSWALLPSSNLRSSVAADDEDDEGEKENAHQSLHVRTASSLWNFISSLGIHTQTPR